LTISDSDALSNEESPQGKAYDWVNFGDPIEPQLLPGQDNDQIILRYTLGVLYFALNGDNWKKNTNWLGVTSECEWFGVKCSPSVVTATTLDLNNNQLNGGTIPPELLGNSSNLIVGNNGKFQVLGRVGCLCIFIYILHVACANTLLAFVFVFVFTCLFCPFPIRCYYYYHCFNTVTMISMEDNNLTGTIPSEFGTLSNIRKFHFHFQFSFQAEYDDCVFTFFYIVIALVLLDALVMQPTLIMLI
jgi:hypothetical protein